MKKIIFICLISTMFFACKSASSTTASSEATTLSTKLDKKTQVALKGNWVLTNVTYPGSDYIKVNSFDLADSKCFIGSTWSFISNNNKGTMALTAPSCTSFSSPIVWSINSQGMFVLKILDAGEKAKKVRDGYLLRVAGVTETSFQLIDNINVGGQVKDVTYQFQRAN
ncbi:zona occludens toxin (predicted ATPase) [Flavobacterium nitrogenifigens]|uniref:Zona occludens toxin (Predicted ATPase) n=2 Tax=Flavobacterium TaxID=237 RepID=A0A7W7IZS1_9FLAO|nr:MULTISPECIES: lipocalin family protein [Flavobacterium]MBB4803601.1 zona occludens toxin (predicted ATPase) [Flavobacterium nitrogenifigens]MBB6388594.1 zona occludens toxin (predicted ATPase) [Flavobacterium notoginsengisoli]